MSKTSKTSNVTKRTVSALLTAAMMTTTVATISASANNAPIRSASSVITIDEYFNRAVEGKSYKQVMDMWVKASSDPTEVFPDGAEITGEKQEDVVNQVAAKLRQYAAAATISLVKNGLKTCCQGLEDVLAAPLTDITEQIFGVKGDNSNAEVISCVNDNTNKIIDTIRSAENKIVSNGCNLNVDSKYGEALDKLEAAAKTYRDGISLAMQKRNSRERIVEVANVLGDMDNWAKDNLVDKLSIANEYFTSEHCSADPLHGYNIYKMAMQKTVDNGAKFMREAVENSQSYIKEKTNKYFRSCMTMLEMLSAMNQVDQLRAEDVAKMSQKHQRIYEKLKDGAGKASYYEAKILDGLFGDNGVVTKSAKYIECKNTEPTTFVGRGPDKPVKLSANIESRCDAYFIHRISTLKVLTHLDWKWSNGGDTYMFERGGLTGSELESICKHAINIGYTVANYLRKNGFILSDSIKDNKDAVVLATSHYNDHHGKAFAHYYADEGLTGYDMFKTTYAKNADPKKWAILKHEQLGLWVPVTISGKYENDRVFVFFKKA